MANTSRPFGFRPMRYYDDSPFNGQSNLYAFSTSQANDCYKGDVVGIDTTNRSTALTDAYAPGIPVILPKVAAITTNVFRGIVVGFAPQPDFSMSATASLGSTYRAASTARYAWVVDDINVVFEVEEGGSSNSYTSASNNAINKCFDIVYTAGNATSGIAKVAVDGGAVTSNAARPFRALRYTQRPDNFNFSASDTTSKAHWDVLIANSDLAQGNNGA